MKADIKARLFGHIEEAFGVLPEYPWARFPGYAVFRHRENRKWFALIMDVPRQRLGLSGEGKIDIVNLKMPNPLAVDMLVQNDGFLPGYHISRGCWISVLLDGTVPFEMICALLEESFSATMKK